MRIVIDLQGAQSISSRNSGIGKYTMSLVRAVVRNRGEHEIIIALNSMFSDTIEPIRATFDGLLPQENIRIWHALVPVCHLDHANVWRRNMAELVREAFLASLRPDIVYVTSLFEGLDDNAVTSIGEFTQTMPTAVTLYDRITSIDREWFLDKPEVEAWYENKLGQLRRADILIAISNDARSNAIEHFGLQQDEVVSIGLAEQRQPKISLCNIAGSSVPEFCPKDDEVEFWDISARNVLAILENSCKKTKRIVPSINQLPRRPRLAYVSPLPPERSGIADYSVEILPELSHHYDIDVIVAQESVSDAWVGANCAQRDPNWLINHADEYERVLYHFGNSHFHQHMFDLLERIPGVVIMHDFYLGHVVALRDLNVSTPNGWGRELYLSHGYGAIQEKVKASNDAEKTQGLLWKYPCNFSVFQRALGVIVHSNHSRQLPREFYGESFAKDWAVVPLPRMQTQLLDTVASREALGISNEAFVVCSFGLLGPAKLNRRLLDAWLASPLAKDKRCQLVFVGGNEGGSYGAELNAIISSSGIADRIIITGWVDAMQYRKYLAAADVAVQLRTLSRGETSAAVLDCMNYGLPTIVNANGAMAELPKDAVWMLADEFSEGELIEALTNLCRDEKMRTQLGKQSHKLILTRYAPRSCADQYAAAIEKYYFGAESDSRHLIKRVAGLDGMPKNYDDLQKTAKVIAQTLPCQSSARQLLIDISAIIQNDLRTGIQRVVRALLIEMIKAPPVGYRIEPVYLTDEGGYWHYLYARRYTLAMLECPPAWLEDDHLEVRPGDTLAVLDWTNNMLVEGEKAGLYRELKASGVKLWFVVYDLLPISLPNMFPSSSHKGHQNWLTSVCRLADGAICISRAVADELAEWVREFGPARLLPLKIDWFHLGADVANSIPSLGMPANADVVLNAFAARPTFLMVGTIEPRKGYTQTLKAFEKLWAQSVAVNLVIVGKQGWMVEELIKSIQEHPELNKRLFWLAGISDEYLEKVYAASTCLIAASEAEGFGLPLIESAQHKLPVIARDIPVFREVAGDYAYYFSGLSAEELADTVRTWLRLDKEGKAPKSERMPWLTWAQCTKRLLSVVLDASTSVKEGMGVDNSTKHDVKIDKINQ